MRSIESGDSMRAEKLETPLSQERTMNFRKPLSVLAFVAFAAPLAAHADAPSGEFYELHSKPAADDKDRSSYAELSIWDVIDKKNDDAARVVSREDVRRELASSPVPEVKA
jgi:hypothetical protein